MKKRILIATALFFALCIGAVVFSFSGDALNKLSSLPGIRLIPPAFAQSAPSEFPDPNAGLSAYVNLGQGAVDFDALTNNVFTEVFFAGDNYVIGNVPTTTDTRTFEEDETTGNPLTVNVRVYIDTNGLVMGYFPRETRSALLFDWDEWDRNNPVLKTTFEEAMEQVAQAGRGTTISGISPSWYHWAYPQATHILMTAKSIDEYGENLFLSIPSVGIALVETPSYSYRRNSRQLVSGRRDSRLIVNGPSGRILESADPSGDLSLGFDTVYTFTHTFGTTGFSEIGIVILYQTE